MSPSRQPPRPLWALARLVLFAVLLAPQWGGALAVVAGTAEGLTSTAYMGLARSPEAVLRQQQQQQRWCQHGVWGRGCESVDANQPVRCVCFAGYLLPSCLYTSDARVPVGLSWRLQHSAPFVPLPPSDDAVASALTAALGAAAFHVLFSERRTVLQPPTAAQRPVALVNSSRDGAGSDSYSFYYYATVEMPGWAAQELVLKDANDELSSTDSGKGVETEAAVCVVREEATAAPPSRTRYELCGRWRLFAVLELADGASRPPLYVDSWMRLYFSAAMPAYYVALPMCGWALGSLVVAVVVGLVECCCAFSSTRSSSSPSLARAWLRRFRQRHPVLPQEPARQHVEGDVDGRAGRGRRGARVRCSASPAGRHRSPSAALPRRRGSGAHSPQGRGAFCSSPSQLRERGGAEGALRRSVSPSPYIDLVAQPQRRRRWRRSSQRSTDRHQEHNTTATTAGPRRHPSQNAHSQQRRRSNTAHSSERQDGNRSRVGRIASASPQRQRGVAVKRE